MHQIIIVEWMKRCWLIPTLRPHYFTVWSLFSNDSFYFNMIVISILPPVSFSATYLSVWWGQPFVTACWTRRRIIRLTHSEASTVQWIIHQWTEGRRKARKLTCDRKDGIVLEKLHKIDSTTQIKHIYSWGDLRRSKQCCGLFIGCGANVFTC